MVTQISYLIIIKKTNLWNIEIYTQDEYFPSHPVYNFFWEEVVVTKTRDNKGQKIRQKV